MDDNILEILAGGRPDFYFVKNEKHVIVDANRNTLSIFNPTERPDIIGSTSSSQYTEEDHTGFVEFDRMALEEGSSYREELMRPYEMPELVWRTRKVKFTLGGAVLVLGSASVDNPLYATNPPTDVLTQRERDCLSWVARGKTAWDTSEILSVSERTVVFHLENARKKLNANNTVHAVAIACKFLQL